jgi:hypothetical protein
VASIDDGKIILDKEMLANEATSSEKCSLWQYNVLVRRNDPRATLLLGSRLESILLLDPASMLAENRIARLMRESKLTARGKKPLRPRATVADSGNSVASLFLVRWFFAPGFGLAADVVYSSSRLRIVSGSCRRSKTAEITIRPPSIA